MKLVKTLIIIFILLLPIFIFGNPPYVELNNLAIIRGIGVSCKEEKNLYFQEIIPVKSDSGIRYQYDYYHGAGDNLEDAFQKLELKMKKKLYLSKIKFLVTDCMKSDDILQTFRLENIKVYHVQEDILKELKKIKS